MLLDVVRWQVIKLAALRCSPGGTRIRANSFRLFVAMLAAAEERVWQDDRRLYTWPCHAQLTKQTALSKGSIGPARQELIAAGLILPLTGRPQARWQRSDRHNRIFTAITRSPEQQQMAEHRAQLRRKYRRYQEDQRPALALNGHAYRFH